MKRIAIIGVTGSGKSTLGNQIGERLNISHIELDSLYWEPDWQPAPLQTFRQRVDTALPVDGCWVCDGNYSKVRDIVWRRADTLIWLNYALPITLWRVMLRTFTRIITRKTLWGTNRETFHNAFFSDEPLFMWAIKTHSQHQLKYPPQFAQPEHAHLTLFRFKSPAETRRWLAALPDSPH